MISLDCSSAWQFTSLGLRPADLSSQMNFKQVEISQASGSSRDSEVWMSSSTILSGLMLSKWLAKQLRSGSATSLLIGQVIRWWVVLSAWPSQCIQNGERTFPNLASRSLVGKMSWTILKRNDFWSGDNPNFRVRWYTAGKLTSGWFCSALEGIRLGGEFTSRLVWVTPVSSSSWYHCFTVIQVTLSGVFSCTSLMMLKNAVE